MFTFKPTRKSSLPSKVHYSEYIRTENKPDADTKPTEPATPTQPEAE